MPYIGISPEDSIFLRRDVSSAPTEDKQWDLGSPDYAFRKLFVESIVQTGSAGMKIPSGSTVQRPSTPEVGTFRYNTDTKSFEYFTDYNTWMDLSNRSDSDKNTFISFEDTPLSNNNEIKFYVNNASAPKITINTSAILPEINSVFDLGSGSKQWNNVYTNNMYINGVLANNTITSIAVTGQPTINASTTADTINIEAGDNITITANSTTKTITIAQTSKPAYDLPFLAGWTQDFTTADLEVRTYGRMILTRSIVIQSLIANLTTAATGSDLILDIQKNGVSVFTTLPKFADGSVIFDQGVLDNTKTNCVAGDIITFVVIQIGSTVPGSQLTLSVKGQEI